MKIEMIGAQFESLMLKFRSVHKGGPMSATPFLISHRWSVLGIK
jgi:hypothetical protein